MNITTVPRCGGVTCCRNGRGAKQSRKGASNPATGAQLSTYVRSIKAAVTRKATFVSSASKRTKAGGVKNLLAVPNGGGDMDAGAAFLIGLLGGAVGGAWLLGHNYMKNRPVALWIMKQIGNQVDKGA